jgi:hypothetical protein
MGLYPSRGVGHSDPLSPSDYGCWEDRLCRIRATWIVGVEEHEVAQVAEVLPEYSSAVLKSQGLRNAESIQVRIPAGTTVPTYGFSYPLSQLLVHNRARACRRRRPQIG